MIALTYDYKFFNRTLPHNPKLVQGSTNSVRSVLCILETSQVYAFVSFYLVMFLFGNFLTIEIETSTRLPCIKLNVTIISLKLGFN